MTLTAPLRMDSFFSWAGLAISAAFHISLFFRPASPPFSQDFAVQPSDFSLEISLIEASSGQTAPISEEVMTAAEAYSETTESALPSNSAISPNSQETPSAIDSPSESHPLSHSPASSTVLACPESTHNAAPLYPEKARKRGWHGVVVLLAAVTSGGTVESLQVIQGSGYEILDTAAIKAVRQWRFRPQTMNGQPTPSKVEIPIRFSLKRENRI